MGTDKECKRMMPSGAFELFGWFLLIAIASGAQQPRTTGGIELLKATPVSRIEAGLPGTRFDRWFADQVRPAEPKYELDDCGERSGTPEERGKQFPMCATVTAIVEIRKIQLSFVVGTYVVPSNGSDAAAEKPAKVSFFSGSIGPSDPRMKFPTRAIRKLSDLEKLLRTTNPPQLAMTP